MFCSYIAGVWDTIAGFEAFLSVIILLLCMATFVLTLRALKRAFKLATVGCIDTHTHSHRVYGPKGRENVCLITAELSYYWCILLDL